MSTSSEKRQFLEALEKSVADKSFHKLSLGHYTGQEEGLKNISARPVIIKRQEQISFTHRYKTRDIVKNLPLPEALHKISGAIEADFQTANLYCTEFDLSLEIINGKKPRLKKSAPTITAPPSPEHDRQKNRVVETTGKRYLHDLKITDENGNVLKSAQDKYRQIDKYIEIIGGLLKQAAPIHNIADMGSGKGYLTFALYDYLYNQGASDIRITGVEYRHDMVDLCNRIAKDSGFENLSFVEGSIADYDTKNMDMLIALHACDTATDDAIYKGIMANAELIVVAPCCHKQIRREMEKAGRHNDLDFLLKNGTFMERQAEMVTDGLRALILEYFGYQTKVFEFISDAHTPKNVMITAIKNPKARVKDPATLQKIHDAKTYFGIGSHHLEALLRL